MKEHNLNLKDFNFDEIESIELIGEKNTIDITVEDTHMFFVNNIYTHNSSISSDIVRMDQMGGSIKRAQVGHLVISIAKSLQQKELGLATIAILKSRFGRDGIVFENCTFDNSRVYINTNKKNIITSFDYENNKEENIVSKNRESVMNAIQRMKKIKEDEKDN